MHEAGLIQEVLRVAQQTALDAGCRSIRRIVLRVGALSSAVPEALEFAFEALKTSTAAAEARLEIEHVAASAFCQCCQEEFSVDDTLLVCPKCGEPSREPRRGFELDLLRIEAE